MPKGNGWQEPVPHSAGRKSGLLNAGAKRFNLLHALFACTRVLSDSLYPLVRAIGFTYQRQLAVKVDCIDYYRI